jgi:hypothetical protein
MTAVPAFAAALALLAAAPASIGSATMETDGTIVLHLRAESPGAVGDGLLRYPPSDQRYRTVRDHLPGLRPGRTVPVAPFP